MLWKKSLDVIDLRPYIRTVLSIQYDFLLNLFQTPQSHTQRPLLALRML